jgi:hypothetical protein
MSPRSLFAAFSLLACSLLAAPVDFNRDVRPILSEKCFHCHGPDEESRKAKLRLDLRDSALADREGFRAIVPGDPDASELMVRILSKDPDEVMPPPKEHHTMTVPEIETLRRWIAEGAPYADHWSFAKPVRPALPRLPGAAPAHPVDRFIASSLAKHGLRPSPEADRHTLLRRVSLDITGLPPTPQEVRAFIEDASPDAYEKQVDRLLASPHFGEKWARMWLDLARYADSTGYGSDKFRLNIWPYRDWAIHAFNRNLPYDQFTIEQLAGDLLPNPTPDQIAATAFHRNTMTQTEGGTDDEEYRVAAVKDRVGVTGQVWMGLTVACAQCHTHKFDPISHQEYYQLFAIFNQTEDSDREDEHPRIPLPTAHERQQRTRIEAELMEIDKALRADRPDFDAELHEFEAAMARPIEWTTPSVAEALPAGENSAAPAAKLDIAPDGSFLATPGAPGKASYVLRFAGPIASATALRIEMLALPSPASSNPTRTEGSAPVMSEVRAAIVRGRSGTAPLGRYVRVEHDAGKLIHLAEVEVYSGEKNIARSGAASQSSTGYNGAAGRAIDGTTDGHYDQGSVSHTADDDPNPWWQVDLGSEQPVDRIVLWNRTDIPERIKGARVVLLDSAGRRVYSAKLHDVPRPKAEFKPAGGTQLALANASASSARDRFPAAAAIDGIADKPANGWAPVAAQGGEAQLVVELHEPAAVAQDEMLAIELTLHHRGASTPARFRISTTDAAPPVRVLPDSIRATLALEPTERTPEQQEELKTYFRPLSKTLAPLTAQREAKQKQLAAIKPVELPIMRELPKDKRRSTHILDKGNFLTPGERVEPGVLGRFHPVPQAEAGEINRLTLAKWIVSPENPLTSRVAVNRFWAQLFGTGLVESEEDLGTQGRLPDHPELLDWLAVSFQTPKDRPGEFGLGWDMKALIRFLVTSHTYRQSSRITPEQLQKDPANTWLARYPRRRLDAEGIRDQALALSGLLSPKIGGPSVYPPQPEGLWNVAFNEGQDRYPTSTGEDRYRRGLYTFWRRIAPHPAMATFDAPSRATCTIRRIPTNTPLQAFVTLNDPAFLECAQALARRILREAPEGDEARFRWALELVLARPATDTQIAAIRELHRDQLLAYREDHAAAIPLATDPLGPLPAGMDPAEAAAWTTVANVLLNLDGVLTKN